MAYLCCPHCADDPEYHEDNEPDTHSVGCGFSACVGNREI